MVSPTGAFDWENTSEDAADQLPPTASRARQKDDGGRAAPARTARPHLPTEPCRRARRRHSHDRHALGRTPPQHGEGSASLQAVFHSIPAGETRAATVVDPVAWMSCTTADQAAPAPPRRREGEGHPHPLARADQPPGVGELEDEIGAGRVRVGGGGGGHGDRRTHAGRRLRPQRLHPGLLPHLDVGQIAHVDWHPHPENAHGVDPEERRAAPPLHKQHTSRRRRSGRFQRERARGPLARTAARRRCARQAQVGLGLLEGACVPARLERPRPGGALAGSSSRPADE